MDKEEKAIVKKTNNDIALMPDVQGLLKLSESLFESGMFPNVKSPHGALAVIEFGRELGLPPVASLQSMAIVHGKITLEAKTLLAIAHQKAGVTWKVHQHKDNKKIDPKQECRMTFKREGFEDLTVSFTRDDAKRAGIVKAGGAWDKYPEEMLFARCSSKGIRRIASDTLVGSSYTTEEMRDEEEIEKEVTKAKAEKAMTGDEEEVEGEVIEEKETLDIETAEVPDEFSPIGEPSSDEQTQKVVGIMATLVDKFHVHPGNVILFFKKILEKEGDMTFVGSFKVPESLDSEQCFFLIEYFKSKTDPTKYDKDAIEALRAFDPDEGKQQELL